MYFPVNYSAQLLHMCKTQLLHPAPAYSTFTNCKSWH